MQRNGVPMQAGCAEILPSCFRLLVTQRFAQISSI
jgi:hypothetical protein